MSHGADCEICVSRYDEYVTCKTRGHTPGDSFTDNFHTWDICEHCYTRYRHETQLVEEYTPDPPEFGT